MAMELFKLGFPEIRTPPHLGAKRALVIFGKAVHEPHSIGPSMIHCIAIDIEGKQLQFYIPADDWNRAMMNPVFMLEVPSQRGGDAPTGALVKPDGKALVKEPDNE